MSDSVEEQERSWFLEFQYETALKFAQGWSMGRGYLIPVEEFASRYLAAANVHQRGGARLAPVHIAFGDWLKELGQ